MDQVTSSEDGQMDEDRAGEGRSWGIMGVVKSVTEENSRVTECSGSSLTKEREVKRLEKWVIRKFRRRGSMCVPIRSGGSSMTIQSGRVSPVGLMG